MNFPTHASEQKSKLVSRAKPVAVHWDGSEVGRRFSEIIRLAPKAAVLCHTCSYGSSFPHWSHFTRLIFMISAASSQLATHRHATP
jgi:hypothetical protein